MTDQAGDGVRVERRDSLLRVIMAARPVNAMSAARRKAIAGALDVARDDPSVRAVLLCSDLVHFSAGLDLTENEPRGTVPTLADLCARIETSPKPVVVAINGSAMAAGLELALAAHVRIAADTARLGSPEVSLGVVPRAGATQRLARLVGAEAALRIGLDPGPVTAAQALAIGLVDQVVAAADLRPRAEAAALALADELDGRAPRRTADRRDGFRDPRAYQAAIAAARARLPGPHLPAAARFVDCIEAAQVFPFEQGLAFESAACDELGRSPQALGLRHAQLAEQRALAPPRAVTAWPQPRLAGLAIWGGGDAVADVSVQALTCGLRVSLVEPARELLIKTVERIAERQEAAVSEGRLSPEARDADWARLRSTMAASALAEADLILTATDATALPIVASVPVVPLGSLPARAAAGRIGLHPAAAPGLLAELSVTQTAPTEAQALILALARRLGWRLLFTGPGGPVDRRLRTALSAAIAALEATGTGRETIAAALGSFGIGVPPRAPLPAAPTAAAQILLACLCAMANEGARMLSEGVVERAIEVDAAAVLGGLFPRWQGGPMYWADQRGLLVLRSDLRRLAGTSPQIHTPDPSIDQLIAAGMKFADLDAIEA